MSIIHALTLWQPWATLVAIGAKRIETRSWQVSYRGPMAIHAASSTKGHEACYREPFRSTLQAYHYQVPSQLPHMRIIAIVNLADIQPAEDVRGIIENRELAFGDYSNGHYAWLLRDMRRLPIEVTAQGHQGLWLWNYSGEVDLIQEMVTNAMQGAP